MLVAPASQFGHHQQQSSDQEEQAGGCLAGEAALHDVLEQQADDHGRQAGQHQQPAQACLGADRALLGAQAAQHDQANGPQIAPVIGQHAQQRAPLRQHEEDKGRGGIKLPAKDIGYQHQVGGSGKTQ